MTDKEKKLVTVSVRGIYKYPKYEDGKNKACISISLDKLHKINELIRNTWSNKGYELKEHCDEDINGNVLLNVASKYDIKVYDTEGNLINECNHGAEVIARVSIKEYEYRGKYGITSYLMGLVVEKQGEKNNGADFTSIMKEVL